MTHDEQRIWLIRQLMAEKLQYKRMAIPEDINEQKDLLRALMNVRAPKSISDEFLQVQDAYLQSELAMEKLTDVAELMANRKITEGTEEASSTINSKIIVWQGDITTLKIDAIVNAANSGMTGCYQPLHSCIDNIIHTKAGIQLRLACHEIMEKQGHSEGTGLAKLTSAYNLPCRYVIHTVGPIVQGYLGERECEQLASCYRSILQLAADSGVKTIAFCCISTGVFMFPNQEAAEIAVKTVKEFLAKDTRIETVVFNVFKELDKEIYEELCER